VPAQNRIWRDDRRHLREQPAPQSVSQLAQPPPLVVGEAQPPTSKPRLEDSILFAKKCDQIRLLTVKPPAHRRDQQFEREHRRSLRCYADRSVGHYGGHTNDQFVRESLMVSFVMVVHDIFTDRASQVALAQRDQSMQALELDGSNEPFRMCVTVRSADGRLDHVDTGRAQEREYRAAPFSVAIANQHRTRV
jgi:hypothetical protein